MLLHISIKEIAHKGQTVTQKILAFGAVVVIALIVAFGGKEQQSGTEEKPLDKSNSFVVSNVRLFDGENVTENTAVIVENGRIKSVGKTAELPFGIQQVDGSGKTLLPGFIDAHTHTYGDALIDSVRFGVTTNLDMFTAPDLFAAEKPQRMSDAYTKKADMFSAGMLATVPDGHGTQYPVKVDTITKPDDAEAWVARRIAEGSDYIKLVYMPYQPSFPSLDKATAKALIKAAHAKGLLAVSHIYSLRGAEDMVAAGTDGLVHIFANDLVTDEFASEAAAKGVFVIPTTAVINAIDDVNAGVNLVKDELLAPYLSDSQKENLTSSFGHAIPGFNTSKAITNIRKLHAAGVDILAGTDAPNPGLTHGASLHIELGHLVSAGLTPLEALRATTGKAATRFRITDRGFIREGMKADMLLVNGDPLTDIANTQDIKVVYKNGYAVNRKPKAAVVEARDDLSPSLTDFAEGLTVKGGKLWVSTTDSVAGGKSVADISRMNDVLVAKGSVNPGFAYPWAGVMMPFSKDLSQPYDLTAYSKLTFSVRGKKGFYRAMMFRLNGAGIPPMQGFQVTEEWKQISLPLEKFKGINLNAVSAISVVAGANGEFQFELKDMKLE